MYQHLLSCLKLPYFESYPKKNPILNPNPKNQTHIDTKKPTLLGSVMNRSICQFKPL